MKISLSKGRLIIKKMTLSKGHFGHQVEMGQVLKHPPHPPARAWLTVTVVWLPDRCAIRSTLLTYV